MVPTIQGVQSPRVFKGLKGGEATRTRGGRSKGFVVPVLSIPDQQDVMRLEIFS